ncbi:speckle-type POZ protein-like [Culex pipiens pallens]|uniref:speckle-type POZ protein-like n=1 Tax=Culex pipiens pallens TaxID=42434 RepID=UPI001952D35D|nr:speckle-type POZ protein-like [Culex pipiens pallens]
MELICKTDCTSTVFHNRWEIAPFDCEQGEQLPSDVFHGYSAHGSDYEVAWHYILEVTESDQVLHHNRFVKRHAVKITTVIDACNAQLEACVELEPGVYHDNGGKYKTFGKTKSGLQFGPIVVSRENYFQFYSLEKVTFRLKFSIIEYSVPKISEVLENYASLLSNEQLSDVTIHVDQKKFYAQRAILSVRSPVFAAMFQSGMQESALNRIVIEDIEPDVFEEVLRFIYVGKVKGLERMAHELLAAADKYVLDRLRKMCEGHLGRHITQETVLKTLALAGLYHADELKDQAVRFICRNIKTMQSTEWKSFAHAHPDLVADILSAMSSK